MLLLCPRRRLPDAQLRQRHLPLFAAKSGKDKTGYKRSGPGLKEAPETLSSTNALFSPLFPEWDNGWLMDYAHGRLTCESGGCKLSSQLGGMDELRCAGGQSADRLDRWDLDLAHAKAAQLRGGDLSDRDRRSWNSRIISTCSAGTEIGVL
jgi:hypothetical protein